MSPASEDLQPKATCRSPATALTPRACPRRLCPGLCSLLWPRLWLRARCLPRVNAQPPRRTSACISHENVFAAGPRPAFLWSQSDVFNYVGQNPRRLFPRLQPVLSAPSNPCRPGVRAVLEPPAPAWCRHLQPPGGAAQEAAGPADRAGRGRSAPESSLVAPLPGRPPHGKTSSQFQVPLASEGSLSRGSVARRAGRVGRGRGPAEPRGRGSGDTARPSPQGQRQNVGLTATLINP